ncbi:UNVERIFIED_CONTAM: hypothetical protein RMT77_003107 [Armadillidium vulgare]
MAEKVDENFSSPEIRQSLVNTAIDFLNMEKILVQPEEKKRQFLIKKGLTSEEIEIAFKNSKVPPKENYRVYDIEAQNFTQERRLATLPAPISFPFQYPRTLWTVVRDSFNMFIYITGIALVINYMYQNYIMPFLTGKRTKTKEEILLEVQASVTEVLKHLESTLEKINNNILLQNEKVSESSMKNLGLSQMEEIKSELGTLKSLLINRNSFPAAPAISYSIPEWQKRAKESKDSKEIDIKEVCSTEENETINTSPPSPPPPSETPESNS